MSAHDLLDCPGVADVFRVLDGDGEETRIVGGALRNAMSGHLVHEIDFATTATPDVVIARCKAAHLRVIPTGIEHGTVTVLVGAQTFEVTTLREDVETDGRHAKVRFGRNFEADAMRRDFTVNAMSLDRNGHVFDYVGGLYDLAAARIRFIGDARQRIREDYLRTLRLFRFEATMGQGPIQPAAFAAAVAERDGLERLSRERVQAEVMKMLAGRRAAETVTAMSDAGLLGALVGGVVNGARLASMARFEESLQLPPDALLRLAAACVLVAEDAYRLRDRLRLSNAQETRLVQAAAALADVHGKDIDMQALRTLLYRRGRQVALDALALTYPSGDEDARWREAYHWLRDVPEDHLPVSGSDIMARGVPPGPAVGNALERLKTAWIEAGFPQDEKTLARLINEAIGH